MPLLLDLVDTLARFPIAYNLQPVRGWSVKHYETGVNQSLQLTKQHALGEGPWDGLEKLWADAFPIDPADYVFHNGLEVDPADAFFPNEEAHPWTAWISAKCPAGITADQADKLFGIYRTLRTPDFDGAGVQIDSDGNPIGGGDPRNYYFFKPNPANASVDQLLRWGKRLPDIVNFPAWVDWRDYNDELISWDDSKYTPRSLSLTPTSGGSLVPGTTYYVRVSTVRGGDVSSASKQSVEIPASHITLIGGQTAFQVNWLIKGDEENPSTVPGDITGFRVYVGDVPGIWLGYFSVVTPTLRTLLITTTAGTVVGDPLEEATAGLLRLIKRFECGLFFIPPYSLSSALDSICTISCADWQWSGYGTGTYRNDKVRFLSPANRVPVFTLNEAEVAPGTFKTWPVDRRSRPNQIIGNWRDRDDPYINVGSPVIFNRELLQESDGLVKSQTFEFGTVYRSQVQRCVSYYARVLCDLDQMASMTGSPKTYHLLPADTAYVTNTTPDWENTKWKVQKKSENVETNIGDPIILQIYSDDTYSDTDHSPLPLPLRQPRFDPFSAPPVVVGVTLSQKDTITPVGLSISIHGDVQFLAFPDRQIGRVFWWSPSDGDYKATHIILIPDPITLQASFEIPNIAAGLHRIKVVTESSLGVSLPLVTHPSFSITIVASAGIVPSNFSMFFDLANGNGLNEWTGENFPTSPTLEIYDWEARNSTDTATIRGPLAIIPALNTDMTETPPLVAITGGGSLLPIGRYTFINPGGATISFNSHEHSSSKGWVQSAASIELVGGARVEVQLPVNRIFPRYFSLLPFDSSTGFGGFFWLRMSPTAYDPLGINYISAEGLTVGYPLTPGDRISIVVQPNGTVEYYINYSPSSHPLYTSANTVDFTKLHKVNLVETDPSFDNSGTVQFGFDKMRWVRQGPEFLYNSEMQKADNGGLLPATVKVRVRQRSFYIGGAPSPWVNGVFVRP